MAMPTEPHSVAQVLCNANLLIENFHKNNGLVIFVRVAGAADGKDMLKPDCDEPMVISRTGGSNVERPKNWSEFSVDLKRLDNDLVVTKKQWGAFYGTELDLELRRRGINTIVLGGIATNYGVESTARDGYERGYKLIFAEDAMASRSAADHDFACKRIFPRIGKVRKVSEIIG
jgi:nicotinamidase-related amidase